MKKIPSLYKRDYSTGLVIDELTSGNLAWVLCGHGRATVKIDGTCCRVLNGILWKRYDRKPLKRFRGLRSNAANRSLDYDLAWFQSKHAKEAPEGWEACQPAPDPFTGHWPGWLPIDGQDPGDKWHMEALSKGPYEDGTYELIGPKVQNNRYALDSHVLVRHGEAMSSFEAESDQTFFGDLQTYLNGPEEEEGIVWWRDGQPRAKIKASDFGIKWG